VKPRSIKDAGGVENDVLGRLVDFDGKRVLEIGCGDGRMTWLYAARASHVLGIDPDPDLIAEARAVMPDELADRVELRVAEAEALEVPPPRFDIAFLSWSL
jgi:ubiquinone/menaquinone biosynthesis C-methylase UbiE